MTESYKDEIQEIKQRRLRWQRFIIGAIAGALLLILLCGLVNAVFFAAGVAIGNLGPFAGNQTKPHMIASYHVNQVPEPVPVIYRDDVYRQNFNAGVPFDWTTYAAGWDVQNGIFYGTNTRGDVNTAVIYNGGQNWRNVVVEADVTAVTTAAPSSAQLLFRAQSEAISGRCQLATRANGQRQLQLITPEGQLLGTSFHFTTGESYQLRATAMGDQLTCEVVGYPATELSARTTVRQGSVGLGNQYITAAFDNLEVKISD